MNKAKTYRAEHNFSFGLRIGLVLLMGSWYAEPVSAEISLSVSALRGISTIDMGEFSESGRMTHEEVTIAIADDSGKQYNLTQIL